MNATVRQLEPSAVWNNFADLNAVPRPSKKEQKVIQFMLDFGKVNNLETMKDAVGNVIIRKPATLGMEHRKIVTLQSHLDMVHQKNSDTNFNFDTDGIEMFIAEDWVKARGTTLGADNGMGVAAIMAILEAKDIPHPQLEALFTIDEETGMTGAKGLKPNVLKGEILLNLDTEEDDEIDIGCAGGLDVTATKNYKKEAIPEAIAAFKIEVRGLKGGHSGMDINRGLGNANKIMNRILQRGSIYDIQISKINGGGLRNAIPRESIAVVVIPEKNAHGFEEDFVRWSTEINDEFAKTEPELAITISATKISDTDTVVDKNTQKALLQTIGDAHNGVYTMSKSIEGLVETSNNIARVEVNKGLVTVGCLVRSSVNDSKMALANALRSVFEKAGFEVTFSREYPGWSPDTNSQILKVLETQYEKLFNEKPKVGACHAGLECGILGKNYPEMDMISFGPTIHGAHSPDERVSIPSVQKFWKFLLHILKHIPDQ